MADTEAPPKRGRGRPALGDKKRPRTTMTMDPELRKLWAAWAQVEGISQAKLIETALLEHWKRFQSSNPSRVETILSVKEWLCAEVVD